MQGGRTWDAQVCERGLGGRVPAGSMALLLQPLSQAQCRVLPRQQVPPLTKAPSMDQPQPSSPWHCFGEIICGGQFQKEGARLCPLPSGPGKEGHSHLYAAPLWTQLRAWSTQSRLRALWAGPGRGSPPYPLPCGSCLRGLCLPPWPRIPHLACLLHGSGSPLCPHFMDLEGFHGQEEVMSSGGTPLRGMHVWGWLRSAETPYTRWGLRR